MKMRFLSDASRSGRRLLYRLQKRPGTTCRQLNDCLSPAPGVGGTRSPVSFLFSAAAEMGAGAGGVIPASGTTSDGGAAVVPASCNSCLGGGSSAGGGMMMSAFASNVQVIFNRPEGMQLHYDVVGDGTFGSEALYVPGRLEFPQGGIYRMKADQYSGTGGSRTLSNPGSCSSQPAHGGLPGAQRYSGAVHCG